MFAVIVVVAVSVSIRYTGGQNSTDSDYAPWGYTNCLSLFHILPESHTPGYLVDGCDTLFAEGKTTAHWS